ncbi:MAG: hypothetical protein R2739_05240 [Chitinophagales bacterium]
MDKATQQPYKPLADNGGASASDICSGGVIWTNDFTNLSDGCGNKQCDSNVYGNRLMW